MISQKAKNIWFNIALWMVFLIGIFLRVVIIFKHEFLWFDELNTYFISKQAFPVGVIRTLLERDFHLPLFYLLLHIWIRIFGSTDLILRTLPATLGILTLFAAYFTGKELGGRRCGLITLTFFAVNSGLIYVSQEVRFYSLLALLSTLVSFFLVRINKNPSKFDYLGLAVINLCIVYTFTTGLLFVVTEILLFLLYLKDDADKFKKFFITSLITAFFCLPALLIFKYFYTKNANLLFSYFDYYIFKIHYLSNVINSINGFMPPFYLLPELITQMFWPLMLISAGIFWGCAFKAISKDKFILTIFLIGLIPFSIEVYLAMLNQYTLIFNHSILSVVCFIISASYGLSKLQSKKLIYVLLVIFIYVNTCTLDLPFNVFSGTRGYDAYLNLIYKKMQANHLNDQDAIIYLPYGEKALLTKYPFWNQIVNMPINDYSLNNRDALRMIFDDDFVNKLTRQNSRRKLYPYLHSKETTPQFREFMHKNVIDKVPTGRYVFFIIPEYIEYTSGSMFPDKEHLNTFHIWKKVAYDIFALLMDKGRFEMVDAIKIHESKLYIYKKVRP